MVHTVNSEILALLVLGAVALLVVGSMIKSDAQDLARLRDRAMLQFRSTVVSSPADSIYFDGSVAKVLEEHETKYLAPLIPSNYILNVIAAMPDGSRYHFRSSYSGKPSIACLSAGHGRSVRVNV